MIKLGGRFCLCAVRGNDGIVHWVSCSVDYYGKPTKDCKRVLCRRATGARRYMVDGFPTCLECIVEGDATIAHARSGAYGATDERIRAIKES